MKSMSDFMDQPIEVDMWIGQSDKRLYRVYVPGLVFSDAAAQGVHATFSFDMAVTDQNGPVDISAPQASITLQQLLQNIFGAQAMK
jgi:hypothetical protein